MNLEKQIKETNDSCKYEKDRCNEKEETPKGNQGKGLSYDDCNYKCKKVI